MEQLADRLSEELHALGPEQLAEVERFLIGLKVTEQDLYLPRAAAVMSAPSFARVWDNPEDDIYNDL